MALCEPLAEQTKHLTAGRLLLLVGDHTDAYSCPLSVYDHSH